MSDQHGNNVDKEVWVPARAKDWLDWIEPKAPAQSLETYKQWALAHADGSINADHYISEGTARSELQHIRRQLKEYGIPEAYHPILMERTVEIVAGGWKPLNV